MATKRQNASRRRNTKSRSNANSTRGNLRAQGEHIFALDIGTRTIVGMVGKMVEDTFEVLDYEVVAHPKRAMVDGQIEDIAQVAKIIGIVKQTLQKRLRIRLSNVSIAAAGRALRTQRVTVEHDVEGHDEITSDLVESMEMATILQAQAEIDATNKDADTTFYCVGHSIIGYALDDYPIINLIGHKGKSVKIELIAAFLPSPVVESLYAVMDENELTITSLTLEPIAAMNVIIPKEIRLINIALVDIGAGTSDIAISRDGSIVAYAMATVAGDEVTEEIIRKYLVSFDMAEQMKQCPEQEIAYTDILGMEHTVSRLEFFESLSPVVESLAQTVCDSIVAVNGASPAAVFLIGGGSLIPLLCDVVASKLDIPQNRVAVGGKDFIKNITLPSPDLAGPEFVTPIGIGVTATMGQSYDFSTISLNGEKIRVFNSNNLTVLDLLTRSGYKPVQLMGRSGRNLTFTVNGSRRVIKGGHYTPAEISLNGKPASIDTPINKGDSVVITPAIHGENATATLKEILGNAAGGHILIAGNSYAFGPKVRVGGREVDLDYEVQNFDEIEVDTVATLGDIVRTLSLPVQDYNFAIGGHEVDFDYILHDKDEISLVPKTHKVSPASTEQTTSAAQVALKQQAPPSDDPELSREISVSLNGRRIALAPKEDYSPHLLFDLLNYTDIDPQNPKGSGELVLTQNGIDAGYTNRLRDGDIIIIDWK